MSVSSLLTGLPPALYEGFCRRCGLTHRWDNDVPRALDALRALFEAIALSPPFQADRDALNASPGKMIGVLVGARSDGGEVILRAFSGELGGLSDRPGWVPAVMRREDTAALESTTLVRIAECDAALNRCEAELHADAPSLSRGAIKELRRQIDHWRAERRAASVALSTAFFDAARLTNARGERWPLRDVFAGRAIAGGATDCAVPRLLEAANVAGVRPLAIAEAWWGRPIGGRLHGACQPPCDRKCLPILGHLLCGLGPD